MAIDTASPRTRRALLTAALGAGAATVVSAIGRPPTAAATDGQVLHVGDSLTATTETHITNTTNGQAVLVGESKNGSGVNGFSSTGIGVYGDSGYYHAVAGLSSYGTGVWGGSVHEYGVLGTNGGLGKAGVVGYQSGGRTGVIGYSGTDPIPTGPPKTGIYGYAAQDANARGVTGQSTAGRGVYGVATTGTGLYGVATTGYALRAVGRVKLDNCAGVATIASGTKSVVVTPGIDITPSSAVVASLMGTAGGTTTVHRSTVDPTANTFTIYLTANSTTNVKVAWHVFN